MFMASTFAEKAETATAMLSVSYNYVSFLLLMKQRQPLTLLFQQMQSKIQERKFSFENSSNILSQFCKTVK